MVTLTLEQRALLTAALANSLTSEQLAAVCAAQPALAALWGLARQHEEHLRRAAALARLAAEQGQVAPLVRGALAAHPDAEMLQQCARLLGQA